eukprot:11953722-Prorocentrum_lima.AAC.1
MTSSLVGSEMCIRDRCRARAAQDVGPLGVHRDAAGKELCTGRRGSGTVSYTHLTLPTICSV